MAADRAPDRNGPAHGQRSVVSSQKSCSPATCTLTKKQQQTFGVQRSTTPVASPRMPPSAGQAQAQAHTPASRLCPTSVEVGRSSSPNYFGLSVDHSSEPRESATVPRANWSPPTSSVKSFGAALPKQLPLDANPEFEAFRLQADVNRGLSFSLGSSHFAPVHMPPSSSSASSFSMRPKPTRRPTDKSDGNARKSPPRPALGNGREPTGGRMDIDVDSLHDSAYVSSDSNRNSTASLNPPSFFDMPRKESPSQSESPFQPLRRSNLSTVKDAQPRQTLTLPSQKKPTMVEPAKPRADTVPCSREEGPPRLMVPDQLKELVLKVHEDDLLLLDVRVSTHYAESRIQGALNLCIPTTLLKRATFDLEKLQKTLQTEQDQDKFSRWRQVSHLVLYDASSTERRDAVSAMNMFKKFAHEGYTGASYLLAGGFQAFASAHPQLLQQQSAGERAGNGAANADGSRPAFAPVIGGVMLPTSNNKANPFFSNIRQNMDLADGVGQMDISVPPKIHSKSLPRWLREASTLSDHGKAVSDKFLKIERNEQARMRNAYSSFHSTAEQQDADQVSLCGVEKGGKNRYKDILPFEHSRVRLQQPAACDYINASYIKASRSNKRYIASQGPLPATFEDFWSVVWDNDVRVIVMLTAQSEGGQLKCHPYWQNHEFGPLKLRPLSEKKVSLDLDKRRSGSSSSDASAASEHGRRRASTVGPSAPAPQPAPAPSEMPYAIIRKFALSHAAHPFAVMREITHIDYPSWPDFGAPAQPSDLLALVELANAMQRSAQPGEAEAVATSIGSENSASISCLDEPVSEARPMLVHCSAGCGRTGTFCAVDSVIDMLKRQRLAANKQRDTDGDIHMLDNEPVMSLSAQPPGRRSSSKASYGPRPKAGVDTKPDQTDVSWLRTDSTDLIEATVEEFRTQRLSMVQSLRQFVLCYETVLEWVWRVQEQTHQGGTGGRSRALSGRAERLSSRR